jgi:hypothetical protein
LPWYEPRPWLESEVVLRYQNTSPDATMVFMQTRARWVGAMRSHRRGPYGPNDSPHGGTPTYCTDVEIPWEGCAGLCAFSVDVVLGAVGQAFEIGPTTSLVGPSPWSDGGYLLLQ